MSKDLKHIDRFFKKSLYDYEESPPVDSWEKIAGDLDKIENDRALDKYFKDNLINFEQEAPLGAWDTITSALDKQNKKRYIGIIYRVAATIAVLIVAGSGYLYFSKFNDNNISKVNTEKIIQPDVEANRQNIITGNEIKPNAEIEENINSGEYIKTKKNAEKVQNINLQSDKENNYQAGLTGNEDFYANNINNNIKKRRPEPEIELIPPILGKIVSNYDNSIKYTDNYVKSVLEGEVYLTENEETEKENLAWIIGGQFSPLFGGNDFSKKEKDFYIQNTTYANEENLLSFSGGLNVNVQPSKRLVVQSGVYYSSMGLRTNGVKLYSKAGIQSFGNGSGGQEGYTNIIQAIKTTNGSLIIDPNYNIYVEYAPPENNGSRDENSDIISGYEGKAYAGNDVVVNVPVEQEYSDKQLSDEFYLKIVNAGSNYPQYNYTKNPEFQNEGSLLNPSGEVNQYFHFVEIPIILKYKLIERKLDFQVIGGLSTNLLIDSDISYYDAEGNKNYIPEITSYNRFTYSSILGVGAEYPIFSKFTLNLEPAFKYHLNPVNSNNFYATRKFSFALYSGINYKF